MTIHIAHNFTPCICLTPQGEKLSLAVRATAQGRFVRYSRYDLHRLPSLEAFRSLRRVRRFPVTRTGCSLIVPCLPSPLRRGSRTIWFWWKHKDFNRRRRRAASLWFRHGSMVCSILKRFGCRTGQSSLLPFVVRAKNRRRDREAVIIAVRVSGQRPDSITSLEGAAGAGCFNWV